MWGTDGRVLRSPSGGPGLQGRGLPVPHVRSVELVRLVRYFGLSLLAAVIWECLFQVIFKLAGVIHRRNHPRSASEMLDAVLDY